ncbi:Dihydroorotate dehydrogenase B (NAD(+)), electron transfer subunit [wastewater metagenome]|uniref:Dihydroorotate dehydrogenase B (NAD(+)), electron transfer subunit n=3 Tax=root TaxID=1 RepID=A0A5B8RA89_9ZZZZ|nr:dihydroorotate dehydrogenase B (NAD(+)), electron transfer subunit [uncultured organism]
MNLDSALERFGLSFEALQQPGGLARLDALFRDRLAARAPELATRLLRYRRGEPLSATDTSALLLELGPELEEFLGELFDIGAALDRARAATLSHDVVMGFKQEFVQRRVKKHRRPVETSFAELDAWLEERTGGHDGDREHRVATYAMGLLADSDANAEAIERVTAWCKLARKEPEAARTVAGWTSFRLPQRVDHTALVPLQETGDGVARREAGEGHKRRRDGFGLTDGRASARAVQGEVHYCIYCHEHDGDFCSKGFPEKKGSPELGLKEDPLGNTLTGCPVEEKISEMHSFKRDGHTLAALAVAMVDNPMIPATGHRICNDCMKACIYQKQDPVDIPQIETRCLTDVLDLPWGVELYHLFTRWNPLRAEQFLPAADNGRRVLVAGMGPAGFTMAHHLTQAGCTVVGVDGLKIEPLPRALLEEPVERWSDLVEDLDERILMGFGGVAEYGITVRWDKNFLKLIYLTLARRPNFSVHGGVRLGGTVTLEDAWRLGFDHVTIATGAGLPRVLHMGNSLARGMRQANDFLMALQLTGAGKDSSLANLQVRLPAVVIGGGLTGVDTATEVQAYYIKQVEKVLHRYETLTAARGEEAVTASLNDEDRETLAEFLAHGRAVRAERERAAAAGEAPDFAPLLREWGGVTIAYRKGMNASPAYTRNHEELTKAMEEGLFYAEGLEPLYADVDRYDHVKSLVCRRMQRVEGRWLATREEVTLDARSIFVAAGTVPNTIYEREYPRTFALNGNHFLPHIARREELQPVEDADHCKSPEFGPFTSYDEDGHRVSFIGDTHPAFNGSVVKAIASAKRSYPQILRSVQSKPQASDASAAGFLAEMDEQFSARVVSVNRENPAMTEVWVRAPLAARNFRAGQFFRLQTFESTSPVVEGTRLQVPLLTVSGTGVDGDCIRLMILQWGAGPRLVGRLQPGDPLVLMGPTGAPTDMPTGKTIMVVAGRWGAAVMLDIGAALRAAGNRVLYVAAFGRAGDVDHQDELEGGADQILWCTAGEPTIEARRPQDTSLVATDMLDLVRRYGDGEVGPADGIPLSDVDRVMVMGGTGLLKGFQAALKGELRSYFAPGVEAFGTVGSPMQCMMKGVCAQCLQWQIDPDTGERTRPVFTCAGQDQPLSWIDIDNLSARQQQNRLTDRLTGQWLDYVFEREAQADNPAGG